MEFFIGGADPFDQASVKDWDIDLHEVVYSAASLCINTVRTFFLVVLVILGPLVFRLSVFDGFQHSLNQS